MKLLKYTGYIFENYISWMIKDEDAEKLHLKIEKIFRKKRAEFIDDNFIILNDIRITLKVDLFGNNLFLIGDKNYEIKSDFIDADSRFFFNITKFLPKNTEYYCFVASNKTYVINLEKTKYFFRYFLDIDIKDMVYVNPELN